MENYGCEDVGKSEGQKLGEQLIDWVNSGNDRAECEDFIKAILNGHRTLQQNLMRVNVKLIEAWSKSDSDLRNGATVKMCKKIMVVVSEDRHLPFI